MRISRLLVAVTIAGLGLPIAAAAPASADTITVHPGESIQAAIDAASPGDVIVVQAGRYRENVNIDKDNITLRGLNAILEPPRNPQPNACSPRPGRPATDGICNAKDTGGGPPETISNIRVTGFTLQNFPGTGIITLFGNRITIEANHAVDNGEYGIASFVSQRVTYRNNTASGSAEAGLYFGDSVGGGNLIVGNQSSANGDFGFFIRDASIGTVTGNTAVDNCSGFMFLDTASGGPGNNFGWRVTSNIAAHNNNACNEDPPLSGIGVAIAGAQSLIVEDNTVSDQSNINPSIVSAGIVVIDGDDFGGGQAAANDISFNTVRHNIPNDIDASGTVGTNTYHGNVCQRSNPPEICDR